MNFSKHGTAEQLRTVNSSSQKMRSKISVFLIQAAVVMVVFLGACGISAGLGLYRSILDSAPDINEIDISPEGYATNIYDCDGNLIQTLVQEGSNREFKSYSEFPEDLINAFVAIEDERFWVHQGIDIRGIIRATVSGFTSGDFSQGASTITQQLIKNNVFDGGSEDNVGDRVIRKLQEQYLALELEENVSKEIILENYLNTINLGSNTLGVQAAANRYFNKDVSELTLSECAVIAAITQNPYAYNPITYPERNAERRAVVLEHMYEQGYITQEEWDEALADNVYDRIQDVNTVYAETSYVYSYFVDELISQVLSDLQSKLGYTESQAQKLLYSGGLKIYTTQDPEIQSIVDTEVNDPENYVTSSGKYMDELTFTYQLTITHADGTTTNYSEGNVRNYLREKTGNSSYMLHFDTEEEIYECIEEFVEYILETGEEGDEIWGQNVDITLQPQMSVVVMDQHTGYVLALTGGRGEKTASLSLNRATQSTRQPGSTFKVLADFAPALDTGLATLASTYYDEPYSYYGNTVSNWWGNYYGGYGSVREAIIYSSNILATRCLNETISPTLGIEYLKRFGITTLVDDLDAGYTLAMGGITNGVTNLELTAAYAAIANNGVYTQPIFYTKIVDNTGKIILSNEPETHQVVSESTAWLLTSAMIDETYSHSQSYTSSSGGTKVVTNGINMNFNGMTIAGKSGTTTSTKDLWFVGFSPYYTVGVWSGYDDSSSMDSLNTSSFHRKIWRKIMEEINEDKEDIGFPQPDSVVTAQVCKISGLLAVPGLCDCDPAGSQVYTEYFDADNVPTQYCNLHVAYTICTESGQIAGSGCTSITTRVFRVVPSYAVTNDSAYAVPQDFLSGNVCYIHSGGYYPEGANLWWAQPVEHHHHDDDDG